MGEAFPSLKGGRKREGLTIRRRKGGAHLPKKGNIQIHKSKISLTQARKKGHNNREGKKSLSSWTMEERKIEVGAISLSLIGCRGAYFPRTRVGEGGDSLTRIGNRGKSFYRRDTRAVMSQEKEKRKREHWGSLSSEERILPLSKGRLIFLYEKRKINVTIRSREEVT